MDEGPSLWGRKEERHVFVLPADAEMDVVTRPENLNDLSPFGGVSRQPLDLDGVANARLCCCDHVAHNLASSRVKTIRPRADLGSIGGHPTFAAGNYERAPRRG